MSMERGAVDLLRLIRGYRLRRGREKELQDGVEEILRSRRIPFVREHRFDAANRVDFWMPVDGVALEIKIRGTVTDVIMQLARYAEFPEVRGLVLLSTRQTHLGMPDTLNGKPLHVDIVRGKGL